MGWEGRGGRETVGLLLDGWMKGTSVIIIHLAQYTILETLSETVVLFEFLERSLCDARSVSCAHTLQIRIPCPGRAFVSHMKEVPKLLGRGNQAPCS